jgi:hypothetical protein
LIYLRTYICINIYEYIYLYLIYKYAYVYRHPEVRALVNALATLMEGSEAAFTGFEDFYQISMAINGLSGMDIYV